MKHAPPTCTDGRTLSSTFKGKFISITSATNKKGSQKTVAKWRGKNSNSKELLLFIRNSKVSNKLFSNAKNHCKERKHREIMFVIGGGK